MNFETTSILLESIKPFLTNVNISISTDNTDWLGKHYQSDFVTIDDVNRVAFEVLENEIIFFYFTEHTHFEDYSSELSEGQADYIHRAIDFLKELLTYPIRHIQYYKGKKLAKEKYFFLYQDGREDEFIGGTWYGLERFINPFGKRSSSSTVWQFDRSKGMFSTRQPKSIDPDAIEVVDINEECYIEIFCKNNTYTYEIMQLDYDDYYGMYYWRPAICTMSTGIYDTKDKAITYAMTDAKIALANHE